jgi:hypothetical protein
MSGFRSIVGTLLTAAALAVWLAAPARAGQGGVFVQANPNTIQAGYQVGILASCGEGLNPAKVESRAFGEITLNPSQGTRFLSGSATVPSDTRPDEYKVDLHCANGSTATTDLFVLGMARPTRGPSTGGGGTATADGPMDNLAPVLIGGASAVAVAVGLGLLFTRRRSGAG